MDKYILALSDWPIIFQGLLASALFGIAVVVITYIGGRFRAIRQLRKTPDEFLIEGIVEEIHPPGIAVLLALANCPKSGSVDFQKDPEPDILLVSIPKPQLVGSEFDWNTPTQISQVIPVPWTALNEWAKRLREKRLIHYSSVHGRGGFGNIYLTELGQSVTRSKAFQSKSTPSAFRQWVNFFKGG